jgi:hypothetical protein
LNRTSKIVRKRRTSAIKEIKELTREANQAIIWLVIALVRNAPNKTDEDISIK